LALTEAWPLASISDLPRVNSWRRYAGFCLRAIAFSALILVMQSFGH
jgi:hypothetical protein